MKTALLLTGNPRFSVDFDSQLENLQNSDIDIYIVLWRRPEGVDPKISPNWCNLQDGKQVIEKIKDHLPRRYSVAYSEVLDPTDFLNLPRQYESFNSTPLNVWQQYTILKYCDSKRKQMGNYNLIVRSRPDLGLSHPIDLQLAYSSLENWPNIIYTPNNQRYGYTVDVGNGYMSGFNDQFAIGRSEVMEIYTNAIDHFDDLYKSGTKYNPEYLVQTLLRCHGVVWPPTSWEIVRDPAHYRPIEHGKWSNV